MLVQLFIWCCSLSPVHLQIIRNDMKLNTYDFNQEEVQTPSQYKQNIMNSHKVQIELQEPVWILEKQAELIRKSDITLTADRPATSTYFTETTQGLQVDNRKDCIPRALYFCLFHLMYEHIDGQRGRQIEMRLKSHIYSNKVKLDQYRMAQIPQQFVQIYDNSAMKKLFIEFTQTLIYERGQNRVLRSLRRYPVMDFILNMVIRTLFHLDHIQPWSLDQAMPTQLLMNVISTRLGVPIQLLEPRVWSIAGETIKIVQQQSSVLIVSNKALVSSVLASGLALSTQDSMPLVQSFEADSLSSSLMSNQNYTPQFHDIKGSVVAFEKMHQQTVSMTNIKSVLSYNTQTSEESPSKFQLHGQLSSFEIPFLKIPTKIDNIKIKNQVKKQPQIQFKKPRDKFAIQLNQTSKRLQKNESESKHIQEDLCRGMTSSELMNFMSPAVARDLNMLKRYSVAALNTIKAGQSPQQHHQFHQIKRGKMESWPTQNSPSTERPGMQTQSEFRRMTFSPGIENPLFSKKKPEDKVANRPYIPLSSTLPVYKISQPRQSVPYTTFDSPRTEKSMPSPQLSPVISRPRLPYATKLNF